MTELTIKRLGHLGDGIADGPVYVPRTLPDEVVSGDLDKDQLLNARILTPSAHRVTAPCRHYRRCGGCVLQHASDNFLANWKPQIVRDALAAHGLDAPISLRHVSPGASRRRATFAAKRTKQGALVGFHVRGSEEITEISACQLLHPDLMAALPLVEDIARLGGSRKSVLKVFVSTSRTGLDIAVEGGKALTPRQIEELSMNTRQPVVARLIWNGEQIIARFSPEQDFDGIIVVPPPGAFLQPTAEGEQALRECVSEALTGARHVVDLFSGCGTFALPLARHARIHAVEGENAMTQTLLAGARHASGLKPVTAQTADLFRNPLQTDELSRFDAAVIDPPRAGAEAQVMQLAGSSVARIAYVSCNPTTFARDARILCAGNYQLEAVEVFDQFRWSPHTELVARFSAKS